MRTYSTPIARRVFQFYAMAAREDDAMHTLSRLGAHHTRTNEKVPTSNLISSPLRCGRSCALESNHDADFNPWSKENIFVNCSLHRPTVRDRSYKFIYDSSVSTLRKLGREISEKHTGAQNTMICFLLLKAHERISKGDVG